MRSFGNQPRRRSSLGTVLLVGLLLILVGAGTVGILQASGLVRFPWQRHGIEPVAPGMVRLPMAARNIPAFTRVTDDYLIDPKTGTWSFAEIPESECPKQAVRSLPDIRRRVTGKEKPAGFIFTEEDFTPRGTLPGVAAGVSANKRALTLEAGKLRGIDLLETGDHVDLIAAVPLDRLMSTGDRDQAWRPGSPMLTNGTTGRNNTKQTETRMLARDAVIVSPLTTRMRPISSSSLMQGTSTRTIPVQEIVLAVNREDAVSVTEAVDMGLEVIAMARSGRPESEDTLAVPPGMVAVPVATRLITAYSEIVRDELFDVRTRELRYVYLPADEVRSRGIVTEAGELLGRVTARDRTAGEFISRSDLLPPGTVPGLTAGVPPGKRAFAIGVDQLAGARGLLHGDHFDLLAGIPVDVNKASGGGATWLPSTNYGAAAFRLEQKAEIRVLAQDAVVVSPAATPKFAPAAASMTASKDVADSMAKSTEEIVIAVSADEVDRLAEALTLGLKLTAVSRSGAGRLNGAAAADQPPSAEKPLTDLKPLGNVHMIETLHGNKRKVLLYAGGTLVEPESADPARVDGEPAAPDEKISKPTVH